MATSYIIFIRLYVQSLYLDIPFRFKSFHPSEYAAQNYVGCEQYASKMDDIHMPCKTSENVLIMKCCIYQALSGQG